MKLIYKLLHIAFLISLLPLSFQAQSADELFKAGNEFFQNKEYQKAIGQYDQVLAQGLRSKDLHYNLGNAYYEAGDFGKAILHYEKAKLLAPFDKDISFNLDLLNKQQKDEINPLPPFFLANGWNQLSNIASSLTWTILGLLLFWMGIAGFVVWQMSKIREQKKKGFFYGFALVLLSLLFFALASNRYKIINNGAFAILVQKQSRLLSAPEAESKELQAIHDGLKMEVLDEIGDWYKVRLLNGQQGWLPKSVIEII